MKRPPTPNSAPSSLSKSNQEFLKNLKTEYLEFSFKPGPKFLFRPRKTIYYLEEDSNFRLLLLHELAHALLGHFSYETSLERLEIERDAWEKTGKLCKTYSIPYLEEFAEEELDTYRNWTHQKTLCKNCGLTCIEIDLRHLYCPFCQKTYKK